MAVRAYTWVAAGIENYLGSLSQTRRRALQSRRKTTREFQLRNVGVTKIHPSTGSSFRVVPVGAPDLR
jgi:hypothetical protein